jgi:thiol-disulfide isomerase/thioredoxin
MPRAGAAQSARPSPERACYIDRVRAAIAIALAASAACQSAPARPQKLELVDAPQVADVAPLVARELVRAEHDRKQLVVYVGASWCEPCRHFHEAAAAGKLDARFGDLRMLVFDDDRDEAALRAAGYTSKLIPLFAIPREDGRASGRQIEGSIHGDGAVEQIAPRLRALVGPAR